MTFDDLFLAFGCIASERQELAMRHLATLPGYNFSWRYDAARRQLALGKAVVRASALGTLADDTWTWTWADKRLPAAARATAERVRRLGTERGVDLFDTPTSPLGMGGVKQLAYVAIGLLGGGAYHVGRSDDDAQLFLIEDGSLPALPPPTAATMSETFFGVVGLFELDDHRSMFRAYAQARGLDVRTTKRELRARLDAQHELVVAFDADGLATDVREDGPTSPRALTAVELRDAMRPSVAELAQLGVGYLGAAAHEADAVYAWGYAALSSTSYNVCFRIGDRMVGMHEVDTVCTKKVDVSDDAMFGVLDRGIEAVQRLTERCRDQGVRMPTQVKVVLRPKTQELDCEVEYELQASKRRVTAGALFDAWFTQLGG